MNFEFFTQKLKELLAQPLPGEAIQLKMAPLRRLELIEQYAPTRKDSRESAVLICFYPHEGRIYTVLMLRPTEQGFHSDQVSFPGGRVEDSDENLQATALREAGEELGIIPSEVTILGTLTPVYIPVSNYVVNPVVGFTTRRPEFVLNKQEVKEIIEVEINMLLDETLREQGIFKSGAGSNIEAPFFNMFNHKIWGATAMILSELEAMLKIIKAEDW